MGGSERRPEQIEALVFVAPFVYFVKKMDQKKAMFNLKGKVDCRATYG
jgi:hypothetical protein